MIGISYRLPYLFHGEDRGPVGDFCRGGEVLPNKTLLPIWKISLFRRKYSRYALTQGLAHSFDMDRHVAGVRKADKGEVYNVLFR